MDIPLEALKNLIATLEESGVYEFEYEDEKSRLRLSFGAPAAPVALQAPAVAQAGASGQVATTPSEQDDANVAYVTSPFVGTFYRSPAPEADVFTDVGQTIRSGQTLCIIEAMKLMNEIESEISGTVLEVLVPNGTSVEFGQKLFKIKKA